MMKTEIGSIYACIAGDHRYGTYVKVSLNGGGSAIVERLENSPVGGMDGPGGSHGFEVVATTVLKDVTPEGLVRAIKNMFDDTIVRYGKPTKKFCWHPTNERGLSIKKAREAIASV